MGKNKFDISFKSNIYIVSDIVADSLDFLRESYPKLNQDSLMEFRLIYCELLFNAVIHGNNSDERKSVFLSINAKGDFVSSVVSDEGIGFDYKKTIKAGGDDENLFLETGRGIRLVKSLVDSLDFDVNGSTVKFCKRVEFDG